MLRRFWWIRFWSNYASANHFGLKPFLFAHDQKLHYLMQQEIKLAYTQFNRP